MRTLFGLRSSLLALGALGALGACDRPGVNQAAANPQGILPTTQAPALLPPNPNPFAGGMARSKSFRITVVSRQVCLIYAGVSCDELTRPAGGCGMLRAWVRNDNGDREDFELTAHALPVLEGAIEPGQFSDCVSNEHPAPLVRPWTKWVSVGGVAWKGDFSDGLEESERIVFDPPPDPSDEVDDAPKASASGGAKAEEAQELALDTIYDGVVAKDEERWYRAGAGDVTVTLAARALCKRGSQSVVAGDPSSDAGAATENEHGAHTFDVKDTWPDDLAFAGDVSKAHLLRISSAGPCRVEYRLSIARALLNDTVGSDAAAD